jgi:hypothetical protein
MLQSKEGAMRSGKCITCKHEDTDRCSSCHVAGQQEGEDTSLERAIEYLEEENILYGERLGEMAIHHEKYRVNMMAIEALRRLQ